MSWQDLSRAPHPMVFEPTANMNVGNFTKKEMLEIAWKEFYSPTLLTDGAVIVFPALALLRNRDGAGIVILSTHIRRIRGPINGG